MIDIRENVVKYYTNMQLLKQKDVYVFFYNILYFAYCKYFEIKSIADFTDFLTRSFSAAVQRCASHKHTFKGQKKNDFDPNNCTYVYNFVHNSVNEVLFKIFAEIAITSAEKNDTPKKF